MKYKDVVTLCITAFAVGIVLTLIGVQATNDLAAKHPPAPAPGVAVGMYDVDGLLLWTVKAPANDKGLPTTIFDLTNLPSRGRYLSIYSDLPPMVEREITK